MCVIILKLFYIISCAFQSVYPVFCVFSFTLKVTTRFHLVPIVFITHLLNLLVNLVKETCYSKYSFPNPFFIRCSFFFSFFSISSSFQSLFILLHKSTMSIIVLLLLTISINPSLFLLYQALLIASHFIFSTNVPLLPLVCILQNPTHYNQSFFSLDASDI